MIVGSDPFPASIWNRPRTVQGAVANMALRSRQGNPSGRRKDDPIAYRMNHTKGPSSTSYPASSTHVVDLTTSLGHTDAWRVDWSVHSPWLCASRNGHYARSGFLRSIVSHGFTEFTYRPFSSGPTVPVLYPCVHIAHELAGNWTATNWQQRS